MLGVDKSTATMPIPKVLLRADVRQYGFTEDFRVLALRLAGCSVELTDVEWKGDNTYHVENERLGPINFSR